MLKTLRITRLHPATSDEDLRKLLSRCGPVRRILITPETNTAHLVAIVEMDTEESAIRAIDELDGMFHRGRYVSIGSNPTPLVSLFGPTAGSIDAGMH